MVNGIPKTEKIWITQKESDGTVYYITSKPLRDMYFLYKEEGGVITKMDKSKSPSQLEAKIKGG